jgi:hypothetical protein
MALDRKYAGLLVLCRFVNNMTGRRVFTGTRAGAAMTIQGDDTATEPVEALVSAAHLDEATAHTPGTARCAERLDYIAEIAKELEVMAVQADCRTLAGLLDLAHQEARRRRRA